MNFIIKREKIIILLSKFNTYVSNSSKNPILSNILLILKFNRLDLIVTNLDMEINYSIILSNKEFLKSGSITVNLNKFYELCKSFPKNENINIFYSKKRLVLSCLNSICLLSTLPVNNFPILNKNILFNCNFFINSYILKNIIFNLYLFIGNQDIYYYLNGMLIEFKNDFLYFVATDGYRISTYKLLDKFNYKKKIFFSVIIPRKLIIELFKLLDLIINENIYFYFNNNMIKVIYGNIIIYSSLIDGSFPDYENILYLSKEYFYIDVNIKDFKNSLLRASIINSNLSSYVTLIFYNNFLLIYSNDFNNNEIKEKIFIKYIGKKIEISFNIKYILDIFKSIKKSSEIRIYMKDSSSIVKIIDINNIFLTYMIMPIQL